MNQNDSSEPHSGLSPDSGAGELKSKITNSKHWMRLLLMILMYIILFYIVSFIAAISMLVQWVLVMLSGEPNPRLRHFTKGLNRYCYQILEFICFNSEKRPFPLSDWPEVNE